MDELNLETLEPINVSVNLGGKKYLLKEASVDAVCRWKNAQLKETRLGPDGKAAAFGNIADADPFLLSLCLFEIDDKGKEKPVPAMTVRSWPNRIQKPLMDKLRSISDLEEKAEVQKNGDGSSASTTDGSV